MSLLDDLLIDEGEVLVVYDDATGKPLLRGDKIKGNPSVGIGRNLLVGVTHEEAVYLAQNDIKRVQAYMDTSIPWWRGMPYNVQRGLGNMAFNMGMKKLMGFTHMLTALKEERWEDAAAEALASQWAAEVGDRAKRIATLFKNN